MSLTGYFLFLSPSRFISFTFLYTNFSGILERAEINACFQLFCLLRSPVSILTWKPWKYSTCDSNEHPGPRAATTLLYPCFPFSISLYLLCYIHWNTCFSSSTPLGIPKVGSYVLFFCSRMPGIISVGYYDFQKRLWIKEVTCVCNSVWVVLIGCQQIFAIKPIRYSSPWKGSVLTTNRAVTALHSLISPT